MGCEVYANNMTIACKVADGKTIAAMPDVCLSPPTPPAGPVPIPYPNTAMASDTTKGSKTVQIGGQEVMLKNKSTFKKSTGDEAATKTLGMGVVSHQITGEVNFCAWSMDVKFEGENVPRHLDLTLHNEMCNPANTPPWPYTDKMTAAEVAKCNETYTKLKLHKHKDKDCGAGKQSHHPAMNACFAYPRKAPTQQISSYKAGDAPAICLEDSHKDTIHYDCTQAQTKWSDNLTKPPTYGEMRSQMKEILKDKAEMNEDESECVMKVVDAYMAQLTPPVDANTPLIQPK
jgi:uncharacterized protein DUF4150